MAADSGRFARSASYARDSARRLDSVARLATLKQTGLLNAPAQEVFERMTRMAAHTMAVPVALVSLADEHRLFFAGSYGLPESWASSQQAPLTHTLCDRVVESGSAVVIADVRTRGAAMENKSLSAFGITAYAGMPLITSTGQVLGSFCVIDRQPRVWTGDEICVLKDFAALALRELEWRLEASERAHQGRGNGHAEAEFRNLAESMSAAILITDGSRLRYVNSAMERVTGYSRSELLAMEAWGIAHPDFRPLIQNRIRARQRGERLAPNFEVKILTKDRRERWANVSVASVQFEGESVAVATAFDITDRKAAEEQVERSRMQLRALLRRLDEVREEERLRISREIHDELGQTLTGLKFEIFALARQLSGDQPTLAGIGEKTDSMISLVDTTMATVRALAADLRPAVLDALGLHPAIEWQLETLRSRTGIRYRFDCNADEIPMDAKHAVILFRILQETLTNVARHAEATAIDVSVRQENGTLTLAVSDNGRGIQPHQASDPRSLGLVGMHERALQIGGTVCIDAGATGGTMVVVKVPVPTDSVLESRPSVRERT